jgi:sporulation-control protein spo0M
MQYAVPPTADCLPPTAYRNSQLTTEKIMFGKVKKWLGIEGVKVELILPEVVYAIGGELEGQLRFHTMHTQTVTSVKVKLVERYSRGRGDAKLIDEYQLAEIDLVQDIEVPADEIVEIDFTLPFTLVKSEIEEFGSKNILFKGLAKAAQLSRNAKSVYRVEAEAQVRGTALAPFDVCEVKIK